MRWQKARGIEDHIEFWVEVGPPFIDGGVDCEGKTRAPERIYRTNVVVSLTPPLKFLRVAARTTELLPQFADDVPLIEWRELAMGAPTVTPITRDE